MFDVTINDPVKGRRTKRRIPRSGRVAARKAAQGIAWIVLWTQITKYFSLEFAQSPDFANMFIIKQMFYLWVLGFTYRLKYYGAWFISEGACILSGLGFNGKTKDGKYKWDRVQNVDPVTFETGMNSRTLLEAWNQNTNKWLKTTSILELPLEVKARVHKYLDHFLDICPLARNPAWLLPNLPFGIILSVRWQDLPS